MKTKIIVLLSLSILTILCFLLSKDLGIKSIATNLFTELLGSIITLIIIDFLFDRQATKEKLQIRSAIYKETAKFVYAYYTLWHRLYADINESKQADTWEFCANRDCFLEITKYLNAHQIINTIPMMTYAEYIDYRFNQIISKCVEIVDNYLENIDSNIFPDIYKISQMQHFSILTNINSSKQMGAPNVRQLLKYHLIMEEQHIDIEKSMNRILRWIKIEHSQLSKSGARNIPEPRNPPKFNKRKSKVRLTDNEIIADNLEFNKWLEIHNAQMSATPNMEMEWCEMLTEKLV